MKDKDRFILGALHELSHHLTAARHLIWELKHRKGANEERIIDELSLQVEDTFKILRDAGSFIKEQPNEK